MISSRIQTVNSAVFLLLIFTVGAVSLRGVEFPETGVHRFFSGETFRSIETHYQDTFPVKDRAIGFWAAVQYQFFKEGRPGVVVGRDEWLFTAEEFRLEANHSQILEGNLEKIAHICKQLHEQGKTVVVALIPEKADLYRQQLGDPSPHNRMELYETSLRWLREHSLYVLDFKAALDAARKSGKQVFLRTDTHWSVEGAKIAAAVINESGLLQQGEDNYNVSRGDRNSYVGDLASYIPTGETFARFGPQPETLESVKFEKSSAADLFAETDINTALIGTSYSADMRYHFNSWLQLFLQQEIANYAEKGQGPFTPMETFIENERKKSSGIDQVVWEIPVRYLVQKTQNTKETKL